LQPSISIYEDLPRGMMREFGIGDWHLNLLTNELYWSPETKRIHEVADNYQPNLEEALSFYPDSKDGRQLIVETLNQVQKNGESWDIHCRLTTAKGNEIWVQSLGKAIIGKNEEVIAIEGFFQDVTVLKNATIDAAKYKQDLAYQQYAFDRHAIVSIGDLEGRIVYANEKFLDISGYAREELIGLNHNRISSHYHDWKFWREFWQQIGAGEVFRSEICNRTKNGDLYWVDSTVVPYINDQGDIERYVSIHTDITDKKLGEEREAKLEQRLQQMQKIEALGQLTGGIAHDFNNMLAVTNGYAELLKKDLVKLNQPLLVKYVEKIISSGEREKELVTKLLAFARGDQETNDILCVNKTLDSFLDVIRPLIPSAIEIEMNIDKSEQMLVSLSPTSHSQLMMNLCLNARDAMPTGGTLSISADTTHIHRASCASCHQLIEGDFVRITVRDTGMGIPADKLNMVFEPFFTTKAIGKGSGMGLAVVHGLLHSLGGHVMLTSVEDMGTRVELLFPRVNQNISVEANEIENETTATSLNDSHIAIIDDEPSIPIIMSAFLADSDAKIDTYDNPTLFFKALNARDKTYDLVITDMMMPNFTGADILMEVRKMGFDMPFIAMTGHSDQLNDYNFREKGFASLLQKPVAMNELERVILNVLESTNFGSASS